jgi:hypothetical protein
MGSTMEDVMRRRQKEAAEAYEAMWDGGRGSHHPDYDPEVRPATVVSVVGLCSSQNHSMLPVHTSCACM